MSAIKISTITGKGLPVRGSDIDTDRIIPARFMKCVTFEGLGQYAFYDVRYHEDGSSRKHAFDDPRFAGHPVLLVNRNFGCGSSREHAPQALARYGIKAIVGESFAEIFAGNCNVMGIPVVQVSAADAEALQGAVEANPELEINIDLAARTVKAGGLSFSLTMPEAFRQSLVMGTWDSTGVLLENMAAIAAKAKALPYLQAFKA